MGLDCDLGYVVYGGDSLKLDRLLCRRLFGWDRSILTEALMVHPSQTGSLLTLASVWRLIQAQSLFPGQHPTDLQTHTNFHLLCSLLPSMCWGPRIPHMNTSRTPIPHIPWYPS